MNVNTIVLLSAIAVLYLISSSDARRLSSGANSDMELSDDKARMFLRSIMDGDSDDADDSAASFDTRETGKNCVACKFGVNPCCAPNICVKKRFRPDECMEIKQGK